MKSVTLVTGGGRSGKSSYALEIADKYSSKAFIATAQPLDDEMRARISKHQAERGSDYFTIEEPVELTKAIKSIPAGCEVAVIDCLSVWLGNLMYHFGEDKEEFSQIDEFLEVLKDPPCDLLIVTNEIGMGIIPLNKMTRQYRDLAGGLNQKVAAVAANVVLCVCGIPMFIKNGHAIQGEMK